MQIDLFDNAACVYYEEQEIDDALIDKITDNTVETWQPDRKQNERKNNTAQGKAAEEIFKGVLKKFFPNTISFKAYDDIRNDHLKKHAPFDFLVWETGKTDIGLIEQSIKNDIVNTKNDFVKLSDYTRKLCEESNVKIVEVKSTKVRDALKRGCNFNGDYNNRDEVLKLVNEIKRHDDIFCYPYYKRSDIAPDYSIYDYCNFVKSHERTLEGYTGEQLREKVIDLELAHQCCDIFVRVYIDKIARRGIVIGWIQREKLLDYSVDFKKMIQADKSERALYFAKNLRKVNGIESFPQIFVNNDIYAGQSIKSNDFVYASPFTRTNFYHKDKKCRYIRNVNENELIQYENEEAAKSEGRYINRCRSCFEIRVPQSN